MQREVHVSLTFKLDLTRLWGITTLSNRLSIL